MNISTQPFDRCHLDRGEGRIAITVTDNMVTVTWYPRTEKGFKLRNVVLVYRGCSHAVEEPLVNCESAAAAIWAFDMAGNTMWSMAFIVVLLWHDGQEEILVNTGIRPPVRG